MASRFWVGGTGTWDGSTTTPWAATSGGAGGQTVPGSGDTVTFDGSSGGGTVTVNTTVNVTSITMGAFTGTLDFNANNNNVTVQTWSNTGNGTRTLKAGSGTWNITGNAATIFDQNTITNCTLSNPARQTVNLTYSGSTGTRTVNNGNTSGGPEANTPNFNITAGTDIVTITTSSQVADVNFTGFAGSWNASTVQIMGSLTISTGMTVTAGSLGLSFVATTGTQIITTNGKTIDRVISLGSAGGTVQLADNMAGPTTAGRILTLNGGTVNLNGKTITCTGGRISVDSSVTFTGQIVRTGSAVVAQAATSGGASGSRIFTGF